MPKKIKEFAKDIVKGAAIGVSGAATKKIKKERRKDEIEQAKQDFQRRFPKR